MVFGNDMGGGPKLMESARTQEVQILFSNPVVAAMAENNSLAIGYGVLPAGTIMAEQLSTGDAHTWQYVPYVPADYASIDDAAYRIGRTFLANDVGATDTAVLVSVADSYRFKVGDILCLDDDTAAVENLGAIVSITRGPLTASVEVTTAVTNAMTVANTANVYVLSGDQAGTLSTAVGVLTQQVDTGTGEYVQNSATGSIVFGSATLYYHMLFGLDANAMTHMDCKMISPNLVRVKG